jgi:hypothetical protein
MAVPPDFESFPTGYSVRNPLAAPFIASHDALEREVLSHMVVAGAEVADPVIVPIAEGIKSIKSYESMVKFTTSLLRNLSELEPDPTVTESAGRLLRLGWLAMRNGFDPITPANREYISILSSTEQHFKATLEGDAEFRRLWPLLPHDIRNSDADFAHLQAQISARNAFGEQVKALPGFGAHATGATPERRRKHSEQIFRQQLASLRAHVSEFTGPVLRPFLYVHDTYTLAAAAEHNTMEATEDELAHMQGEAGKAQADWLLDAIDLTRVRRGAATLPVTARSPAGKRAYERIAGTEPSQPLTT